MVIGWAGLPDDLAKWRELIDMLLDKSWLSWLFILAGLLILVVSNWHFIVRQTQGFLGHASALLSVTQNDFMVDVQYVILRGLATILAPIILLKVLFDIEVPPIILMSVSAAFGIWLYVRRLGLTERHKEQEEVLAILRWVAGLFAIMVVIGVLVVISLEIVAAFKAFLHHQFGTFRENQ